MKLLSKDILNNLISIVLFPLKAVSFFFEYSINLRKKDIYNMKHLFIFILCISISIHSASSVRLSADGSIMKFDSSSASFVFSDGKASFKGKYAAAGEIDRKGMIRFLSDPYTSPMILKPVASAWKESGINGGTVIDIQNSSFIFPFSERKGFGVYVGLGHTDAAVLFMDDEEPEPLYAGYSGFARKSIYGASSLSFSGIRLLFAISLSSLGRVGFFGALSAELFGYSLSIRIGQIEPLYKDSEEEYGSIELKAKHGIYSMDFLYVLGMPALYSFEYQNWKMSLEQTIKADYLSIEFGLNVEHDRKGHEKKSYKMEVDGLYLSFACIDASLSSFSMNLPGASLLFDNGRYCVKLNKALHLDNAILEISLSTFKGLSLRVIASL